MAIIVLWILLGIIAFIVILLHFSITCKIRAEGTDIDIKVKYLFFTIYPRKPKKRRNKKSKSYAKSDERSFDEFEDNLEDDLETEIEDFSETESTSKIEENSAANNVDEHVILDDNLENIFDDEQQGSESEEKDVQSCDKTENAKKKKQLKKSPEVKQEKKESKIEDLKKKYQKYKPYIPMGWKYFKKLLKTIRITNTDIEMTIGKEDAFEAAMSYGKIQGALFNVIAAVSGIFTVKIKRTDVKCVFDKKVFKYKAEAIVRIRPSAVIAIAFCLLVSFLQKFLPPYIKKRRGRKKKIKAAEKKNKKNLAAV